MRKFFIPAACVFSLLALAGLVWAQSNTMDPQQQRQGAPAPYRYGPGMMGPGGGGYGSGGMMGPGGGGAYGPGMSPNYQGWQSMSPKEREAWQQMYHQFQLETLDLRKTLAAKQLESETLWASPKPDHNRLQALSDEIVNLQAELAKKRNQFLVKCRQQFGDRGWSCPGVGAGF